MADVVRVQGLRELRRALKRASDEAPRALRRGLNVAVDIVVAEARPRVPRLTGRAASSIRAQSTQTAARIRAGGTRVPYYPWLDFGGKRRGRGGGIAARPFRKSGRYIWAAFGKKREEVIEEVERQIVRVIEEAGLEVRRG